jgi:hypothetical protein
MLPELHMMREHINIHHFLFNVSIVGQRMEGGRTHHSMLYKQNMLRITGSPCLIDLAILITNQKM